MAGLLNGGCKWFIRISAMVPAESSTATRTFAFLRSNGSRSELA
jgi:hypothetical protein